MEWWGKIKGFFQSAIKQQPSIKKNDKKNISLDDLDIKKTTVVDINELEINQLNKIKQEIKTPSEYVISASSQLVKYEEKEQINNLTFDHEAINNQILMKNIDLETKEEKSKVIRDASVIKYNQLEKEVESNELEINHPNKIKQELKKPSEYVISASSQLVIGKEKKEISNPSSHQESINNLVLIGNDDSATKEEKRKMVRDVSVIEHNQLEKKVESNSELIFRKKNELIIETDIKIYREMKEISKVIKSDSLVFKQVITSDVLKVLPHSKHYLMKGTNYEIKATIQKLKKEIKYDSKLGEQFLPYFLKLCQHSNENVRMYVILAIGVYPLSQKLLVDIETMLDSENSFDIKNQLQELKYKLDPSLIPQKKKLHPDVELKSRVVFGIKINRDEEYDQPVFHKPQAEIYKSFKVMPTVSQLREDLFKRDLPPINDIREPLNKEKTYLNLREIVLNNDKELYNIASKDSGYLINRLKTDSIENINEILKYLEENKVTDKEKKHILKSIKGREIDLNGKNTLNRILTDVPLKTLERPLVINNIEQECIQRDIKFVYHFTNARNLPKILKDGLLSVSDLDRKGISFLKTDYNRFDNQLGATCWSISHSNSYYLDDVKKRYPDQKWCIIEVESRVLWKKRCYFNETNAASNLVRHRLEYERNGIKAFKDMFNSNVNNYHRADSWQNCYPTDVQAEVLIFESILPQEIKSVYIHPEDKQVINYFSEKYPQVTYQVDSKLFGRRNEIYK